MRWMVRVCVLAAVATLLSGVPATAQWLTYPTPGVPRLADGTPDLNAPAPRSADGKPDLGGVWQLEPRPCAPEGCGGDYQPGEEFFDLGAKLPGGLPYQPWAAAMVKSRMAEFAKDDPIGFCRPGGAIRMLTYPPYRKFLQLPQLFVILSERDVTFRQVFMDGRPLPDDPTANFNGYSVGRWDGDSLVVQTNGLRDGMWLDRNGSPITDAARVTERFRRVSYGRLDIDLTVDDPKAYTKPWTVTLRQRIVPDTDLLDYYCTDNEKSTPHMVGK